MVKGDTVQIKEYRMSGIPFNKGGIMDTWPTNGEIGVIELAFLDIGTLWVIFPNRKGSWPLAVNEVVKIT